MLLHGLNKLTLLDFPGHIACTVFTGHCNMRCPFCHNAPLVLFPDTQPSIPAEEFFLFLKKRQGILEGVCVTGGEPTLSPDLLSFLARIKGLGYLVKLDTNGTNPAILQEGVSSGLIDYAAMDIKSSPAYYPKACGIPDFCTDAVMESAAFLMQSGIPYEFRTTVVRELHDASTLDDIAAWLHGAHAYYLQSFEPSDDLICNFSDAQQQFSAYSPKELNEFLPRLRPHFDTVGLRGI